MSTWKPPRVSEFTPPSELCPHPEWWSAWNPVSTEVEVSILIASLVRATQPEFVVEVGAHYGQTTERIGQVLIENGHGEIVALEIDHGLWGSATYRCQNLPKEIVSIIEINSLEYVPEKPVDFLFIDGSVKRSLDFEHYLPFLSRYPTIVVHDTAAYLEETARILDLWKGDHIELNTPRGVMILMR
jgi:predicted O-methyltransferase YrrM